MKKLFVVLSLIVLAGCSSWNRTQKGAAIGTAGGAAIGAVIGKVYENTALGAIIGAAVGGAAGAIIGHQMDKQAEEMQKEIPDAKVIRVGEGIVIEFNNQILFGFDKSSLTTDARENLAKLVDILKKYPDTNVEVQGHTDNTGSESYNKSLSKRRASTVSKYLSSNGVASSRLTRKGFGEIAPKYTNESESGRSQNRRVEFMIAANAKMKADAEKEAAKNK
jgi:outer membrane protein OmpA-like peptidoglycan-associated protein